MASGSPLEELKPVAHASDIRALVAAVRDVHVSGPIRQYIIDLVNATRTSAELRLGASPRAALHLLRASRAYAALDERDFVIPDDVQALAVPVLAHRLLPSAEAMVGREMPDQVLSGIVRRLPAAGPLGRIQSRARAAGRTTKMRTSLLAGMTTRGTSFLAAGVAAAIAGYLLGERGLLCVGIALLALPLLAAAAARRGQYRLATSRISQSASGPGRAHRHRDVAAGKRFTGADRAAAGRGHRAVRARFPAQVRAGQDRARRRRGS